MYFKKHITKDRIIIAICDEDLVGKEFSEGEHTLNISERFYKGEKKSKEELENILKNSENINLVGKKTINFALKLNLINKGSVIEVKGIPHAQIIQI
tara:strand:- start:196 stop:486 length:291 start_codon:yes stop_codon:yes gene_type:complete